MISGVSAAHPDAPGLITLLDDLGGTIYVGKATVGASTSAALWRIMRVQTVGTITTVLFAGGDHQFDKVWDDRAAASYA